MYLLSPFGGCRKDQARRVNSCGARKGSSEKFAPSPLGRSSVRVEFLNARLLDVKIIAPVFLRERSCSTFSQVNSQSSTTCPCLLQDARRALRWIQVFFLLGR